MLKSLKWMRGKWRTAWWSCRSRSSPSNLQVWAWLSGRWGWSKGLKVLSNGGERSVTLFNGEEGYLYPSSSLKRVTLISLSPPFLKTFNPFDLPHKPLNQAQTWRFKGEDLDLQLHQAVLHFPLIHLRDFVPRVSLCGKPRLLDFLLVCCCCNRFVVCLRAPNLVVGVCLKLVVRATDSALKDSNSGRWTRPLWRSSSENRVRHVWH